MTVQWSIWVPGEPRGKGSLTPYGAGKPIVRHGERYYRIKDVRLKQRDERLYNHWIFRVRAAGMEAGAPPQPLDGPWFCKMRFFFRPPKKPMHDIYAIGGGARGVDANGEPLGGNIADVDKLERAILDALQGIYWTNDKRVAWTDPKKTYAPTNGARLELRYLEDEQLSLLGG